MCAVYVGLLCLCGPSCLIQMSQSNHPICGLASRMVGKNCVQFFVNTYNTWVHQRWASCIKQSPYKSTGLLYNVHTTQKCS